jgi:predicted ATPase/DNA-binding SARP family transcriptional activator
MPPRLVLAFLGLPQVHLNDNPIATDRRKAIALLAYLAVSNRGHSRQNYSRASLSALFWPEYEQAKAFSNLRRTIWEVHQALGEGWLVAERESVQLNPGADIDLDIARFLDLIAQARQQEDLALRVPPLSDAVKLYRNHFLTGFSLKDAYPFNEWAFVESEGLRHKLADALMMLVESHCALKQADLAIPYARRLITLDPLNESAHRQLMEVYLQAGQRSAALKQYQTCEQILRKELNLDPQPETRALYKRIHKREIKTVDVAKPTEINAQKHNLPAQLSTFIGREKEQDEITNLLEKNRFVTLAGVGGIGKTRLSLKVGQNILNSYPDGVWFIPLDSLSDSALVPLTVASVFDIREGSSDRRLPERLTDFLRPKTVLLILDNCEHLLDACAKLIKTLLTNCPKLRVLVTSREILNVESEATYYLRSLSVPHDHNLLADRLTEYESVQLFTARAALALSSFRLTKENGQTVVDICRRVDGIPLAIELAAARVNILQVQEILKQLNDSFLLLANNTRGVLPRHETLWASMDWSWQLLTESEQSFLRQLSVFVGGWTLESAQTVCNDDVLKLTNSLVNKSLIIVERKQGQQTRYQMLDTIRDFTLEKLKDSGERNIVCLRHLLLFTTMVEEAEKSFRGPNQAIWYNRLDNELNNLRIALTWFEGIENAELKLRLAAGLWRYWKNRGHSNEGRGYLQRILEDLPSGPSRQTSAYARALNAAGALAYYEGDFSYSEKGREEALAIFRVLNDKVGIADCLIGLGNTSISQGNYDSAREFYEEGLLIRKELVDIWGVARLLGNLGLLAFFQTNYIQAHSFHLESLALFRELQDDEGTANELINLGDVFFYQGELSAAKSYYEESASISRKMKDIWGIAYAIKGMADVAFKQNDLSTASALYRECLILFQKTGDNISLPFALESVAALALVLDHPEKAARIFGAAETLRKSTNSPLPPPNRPDYQKNLDILRQQLGPDHFDFAWAEGCAMKFDEAVAYALKEEG